MITILELIIYAALCTACIFTYALIKTILENNKK